MDQIVPEAGLDMVACLERVRQSDEEAARDLAHKMLETLSPKDRLILTMLDLEERSVEEIRELTGWNASLIKVRAFRARMKLRKQFAKILKEERQ